MKDNPIYSMKQLQEKEMLADENINTGSYTHTFDTCNTKAPEMLKASITLVNDVGWFELMHVWYLQHWLMIHMLSRAKRVMLLMVTIANWNTYALPSEASMLLTIANVKARVWLMRQNAEERQTSLLLLLTDACVIPERSEYAYGGTEMLKASITLANVDNCNAFPSEASLAYVICFTERSESIPVDAGLCFTERSESVYNSG